MEPKIDVTKLATKKSGDSSGERKSYSKKPKANRKIGKAKLDRGASVGDVSQTDQEPTIASISAKLKSSQSAPTVTKTNRKGFVVFQEGDVSLEPRSDVTKLAKKKSGDSSGERKASSKKPKANRKNGKAKLDCGTSVGDTSQTDQEQASTSVKSKSSQSVSVVTKTNRNGFVIFPARTSLPSPSELKEAPLAQVTDRTGLHSAAVDRTQAETVSENQSLPVEGEKVPLNFPSLLGVSNHDRDRNMQLLLEAGFSEYNAKFLLDYLPLCLKIDYRKTHRVTLLLEKHKLDWKFLLKSNAMGFAVEPEHVR